MVQTFSSLGIKTKPINSDTVQKVIQSTEQKLLQPTGSQNAIPSLRHHLGFSLKKHTHKQTNKTHSIYVIVVSRLLPNKIRRV